MNHPNSCPYPSETGRNTKSTRFSLSTIDTCIGARLAHGDSGRLFIEPAVETCEDSSLRTWQCCIDI
jgi:hypothetical protein